MPAIDAKTLGALYRQHAPALCLFARQWSDAALDLVHDAFVQLARQSNAPDNVQAWLYCVVRNQARSGHRQATRRREREARASVSEQWFSRVDDQLDAREAVDHLAQLPLEQREVIVARLWGGLTFDEVARLVGCALPTAHRRYHAGLAALRERLEGPCKPTSTLPTT